MEKLILASLAAGLVLSLGLRPGTESNVHAATEQSAASTDTRQEVAQSEEAYTQNIVLVQEDGKDEDFGTGVRLNAETVLTNRHVVDAIDEQKLVVKLRDANGEYQTFAVTEIHAAPEAHQDLALLKIKPQSDDAATIDTEASLTLASLESIQQLQAGDTVHTVGYPGDKAYGSLWRSEGDVQEIDPESGVILFGAHIAGGNSGSPLFNKAGEIIGLVNATSDDPNEPLSFGFVFTESLYAFIQQHL